MEEVRILVEADINPTEDEGKVRRAVENIFNNLDIEVRAQRRGATLIGAAKGTDGLTKLYNLLRRERIRAAARAVLYRDVSEHTVVFCLNKQAAYAGHVSFSQPFGESPLGPIRVEVSCDNPIEVIDWLAPRTQE